MAFLNETRVNPRARIVQQNGHKCRAAIPLLEQQRQYELDEYLFSFTFAVQLCGRYYYVTLPIHSHAEITVVIANPGIRIFAILMLNAINQEVGMN